MQLKIKLLSASINAKNVVITFDEAAHLEYLSKDVLTDLIPSLLGILCIMILHPVKQGMSCLGQSQFGKPF